jgi:hypothetical protein
MRNQNHLRQSFNENGLNSSCFLGNLLRFLIKPGFCHHSLPRSAAATGIAQARPMDNNNALVSAWDADTRATII